MSSWSVAEGAFPLVGTTLRGTACGVFAGTGSTSNKYSAGGLGDDEFEGAGDHIGIEAKGLLPGGACRSAVSKAFVPEPVEGEACDAVAAAAGFVVGGGGEVDGAAEFGAASRSIAAKASLI